MVGKFDVTFRNVEQHSDFGSKTETGQNHNFTVF